MHAAPLIGSIITMIFANLPWVGLLHHLLNYTLWETRGKLPANEQNSIYNTAKISKTIDEAFWKTLYGAGLILQKDIDKFCHLIWPMKWCVTKPPFSNHRLDSRMNLKKYILYSFVNQETTFFKVHSGFSYIETP